MPYAVKGSTVHIYLSDSSSSELLKILRNWNLNQDCSWLDLYRVLVIKEMSSALVSQELWELQKAFKTLKAIEFKDWKLNPQ